MRVLVAIAILSIPLTAQTSRTSNPQHEIICKPIEQGAIQKAPRAH